MGDDAPWIGNLAKDHFYDSHQVVDWYHGVEHLASAGHLLYGEEAALGRWLKSSKTELFQGEALRTAQELTAAAKRHTAGGEDLEREGNYFRNNHRRMNYQGMREDGWVIGRGSGSRRHREITPCSMGLTCRKSWVR